MVRGNEGVYALKITDWMAFETEMKKVLDLSEENLRIKEAERNNYLADKYRSNPNNLEKEFLKYMQNSGLNSINLMKADTDLNWSKLSLNNTNPSNLTVTSEPCNP